MKVTNLEAAHRQLITAIDLFFDGADPVSVHSLACNARENYEKCLRTSGKGRFFDVIRDANPHYTEKEIWGSMNHARNFFKHPELDLSTTCEITCEMNKFTLFVASHDCGTLSSGGHPLKIQTYQLWFWATDRTHLEHPNSTPGESRSEVDETLDQQFPGLRQASDKEQRRRWSDFLAVAQGISPLTDNRDPL